MLNQNTTDVVLERRKETANSCQCLSQAKADEIISELIEAIQRSKQELDQLSHRLAALTRSISAPLQAEQIAKPAAPKPVHPDGPEPPNTLWIGGQSVQLEPKSFKLISFMWDKKQAQIVSAAERLWKPTQNWNDAAFANHISKANAALLGLNASFVLSVKGDFVLKI